MVFTGRVRGRGNYRGRGRGVGEVAFEPKHIHHHGGPPGKSHPRGFDEEPTNAQPAESLRITVDNDKYRNLNPEADIGNTSLNQRLGPPPRHGSIERDRPSFRQHEDPQYRREDIYSDAERFDRDSYHQRGPEYGRREYDRDQILERDPGDRRGFGATGEFPVREQGNGRALFPAGSRDPTVMRDAPRYNPAPVPPASTSTGSSRPLKSILKKKNDPEPELHVPSKPTGLPGISNYMDDIEDEEKFLYGGSEDGREAASHLPPSRRGRDMEGTSMRAVAQSWQPAVATAPSMSGVISQFVTAQREYVDNSVAAQDPRTYEPEPHQYSNQMTTEPNPLPAETGGDLWSMLAKSVETVKQAQAQTSVPSALPRYADQNQGSLGFQQQFNTQPTMFPAAQESQAPPVSVSLAEQPSHDPTIENILKSIGFDFDMSKRMQEKAKQASGEIISSKKIKPEDQLGINQTASFIGSGVSHDDMRSSLEISYEKMPERSRERSLDAPISRVDVQDASFPPSPRRGKSPEHLQRGCSPVSAEGSPPPPMFNLPPITIKRKNVLERKRSPDWDRNKRSRSRSPGLIRRGRSSRSRSPSWNRSVHSNRQHSRSPVPRSEHHSHSNRSRSRSGSPRRNRSRSPRKSSPIIRRTFVNLSPTFRRKVSSPLQRSVSPKRRTRSPGRRSSRSPGRRSSRSPGRKSSPSPMRRSSRSPRQRSSRSPRRRSSRSQSPRSSRRRSRSPRRSPSSRGRRSSSPRGYKRPFAKSSRSRSRDRKQRRSISRDRDRNRSPRGRRRSDSFSSLSSDSDPDGPANKQYFSSPLRVPHRNHRPPHYIPPHEGPHGPPPNYQMPPMGPMYGYPMGPPPPTMIPPPGLPPPPFSMPPPGMHHGPPMYSMPAVQPQVFPPQIQSDINPPGTFDIEMPLQLPSRGNKETSSAFDKDKDHSRDKDRKDDKDKRINIEPDRSRDKDIDKRNEHYRSREKERDHDKSMSRERSRERDQGITDKAKDSRNNTYEKKTEALDSIKVNKEKPSSPSDHGSKPKDHRPNDEVKSQRVIMIGKRKTQPVKDDKKKIDDLLRTKSKLSKEQEALEEKIKILENEHSNLKSQQEDLQKLPTRKDGNPDPILVENNKLIEEIAKELTKLKQQQKDVKRKYDRVVKEELDAANVKKEAVNTTVPARTSQEFKVEKGKLMRHYFVDDGNHWCKPCKAVFTNFHEYVQHLTFAEHKQSIAPDFKPWKEGFQANEGMIVNKNGVRVPLPGAEFLMPATAFYCQLCKVLLGDVSCSIDHFRCESHYLKYKKYCKENPHYERKFKDEKGAFLLEKKIMDKEKKHEEQERINRDKLTPAIVRKRELEKKQALAKLRNQPDDDLLGPTEGVQTSKPDPNPEESIPKEPEEGNKVQLKIKSQKLIEHPPAVFNVEENSDSDKDDDKNDNQEKASENQDKSASDKSKIAINLNLSGKNIIGKTTGIKKNTLLPPWQPVSKKSDSSNLDNFLSSKSGRIPVVHDGGTPSGEKKKLSAKEVLEAYSDRLKDKELQAKLEEEQRKKAEEEKKKAEEERQKWEEMRRKVEEEIKLVAERKTKEQQKAEEDMLLMGIDPESTAPLADIKPPPPPSQNVPLPPGYNLNESLSEMTEAITNGDSLEPSLDEIPLPADPLKAENDMEQLKTASDAQDNNTDNLVAVQIASVPDVQKPESEQTVSQQKELGESSEVGPTVTEDENSDSFKAISDIPLPSNPEESCAAESIDAERSLDNDGDKFMPAKSEIMDYDEIIAKSEDNLNLEDINPLPAVLQTTIESATAYNTEDLNSETDISLPTATTSDITDFETMLTDSSQDQKISDSFVQEKMEEMEELKDTIIADNTEDLNSEADMSLPTATTSDITNFETMLTDNSQDQKISDSFVQEKLEEMEELKDTTSEKTEGLNLGTESLQPEKTESQESVPEYDDDTEEEEVELPTPKRNVAKRGRGRGRGKGRGRGRGVVKAGTRKSPRAAKVTPVDDDTLDDVVSESASFDINVNVNINDSDKDNKKVSGTSVDAVAAVSKGTSKPRKRKSSSAVTKQQASITEGALLTGLDSDDDDATSIGSGISMDMTSDFEVVDDIDFSMLE